ncbi:protein phosphatase 1 regulatory subunit 12B isoform X1 [Pseudochaenichthys georgianus]|uniref:protein phosphatase 1 regulatory subunit 12B isoform X1 n=1 Tax=Pseudochaenichthys georgianus TaxID=52239 RepID=UPI00146E4581|nr:protein phosphatase 1 regulatory subunit 12A-like [Pseudochaenichthys georgianus]
MQAFVPRSYLTPVRDEEVESQRKAKSRHARQTRRSTQGVTLTDLKEAQKTTGASPAERQTEEGICLRKGSSDDRRLRISPTESTEISTKWSKMDDQGNIEPRLEAVAESPVPNLPYSSVAGSCGLLSNTSFRAGERMWRDENQNPVEKAAEMTFAATLQQKRHFCERSEYNTAEHERLSRYDSSGESVTDKPLGRTSSYTRRETRLAALNRAEQDPITKDYKKMYAEALHENDKLKSRLQDSKQELVKIRSQLDKVTQRHDRISERSTAVESEKREKQALEKRVSNMEDEIKAFPPLAQAQTLRRVNECLLAENKAMLRVLARLSETAAMPETEDL